MRPSFRDLVIGDPIDAALVRAATRKKLFGIDEAVTIGRLVVQHRLGAGAIGVVYQALDPELGRTVAVKLLQSSHDEDRLIAEARALARLRHPNVVAVHDVGTWKNRVFLTMEHVPGGTLRGWLAARPRTWREIVPVLVRAGRGLAAAHRNGLVHRDVKPDNVLVADDGEVRIADFGLARPAALPAGDGDGGGVRGAAAHETSPAGTPAYLAPEVLAGRPADALADQYGFCVMASEALRGERADLFAVPAHLRRAIARGLAVEPASRFPSMEALLAALDRDPARSRRRVIAIAALVVVMTALSIVAVRNRGAARAGDACAAAGAGLDAVWTADKRAAVERAGAPPSALAAIDAYAEAWRQAGREACLDTHVRHRHSPALLDLRTRCLARSRAALEATVGLLAEDAATGALVAVESLPDLAACADLEALSAPVAAPAGAAARARLAELERRLAAATARANANQLDDAIAEEQTIVADARALGHRPFVAEALFALATTQRTRGDKAAAATTAREALGEAQASRHDEVVVSSAITLSSLHADGEVDRAEELLGLAAATIERLGNAPRLLATYESTYGKLMFRAGRPAEAVAHLERAVAQDAAAGRAGTLGHAQLLTNLGGAYAAVDRTSDALPRLERALALREQLLGVGHPDVAETLNTLGITLRHLGRLDEAMTRFDRARDIVERLGAPVELWSMILDNRAGALGTLGRVDEALADMRRSVELAERTIPAGDVRLAAVYTNLATVMQDVPAVHAEAVTILDKALALFAANGQAEHPDAAVALLMRGILRLQLGQKAAGSADCARAREIVLPLVGADHPIAAEATACVDRSRKNR